ncbi:Gll4059 protein [alpha proteobacterium U9-1i]|nr:Gll4059 protein [alpha proteobacterium U9-1i]
MARMTIALSAYDHVGLRVTDARRSLAFYREFGFEIDPDFTDDRVAEIVNVAGLRINLIFNGVAPPDGRNVLLDVPEKWPGYTHAAFIVEKLATILDWAAARGIAITEGPVDWGRRITCFLRDPDGNVLEFNELKA